MQETYIVKKGDTLYGISNQFGVSVSDIIKLNNLGSSNIQVNQILMIPNKSGSNPNNTITYSVQKGDSLYSIAKKYNTTVNEIIKLNNLANNNLSIGQKLIIPENYNNKDMPLPNYKNYIVKKGDNLYSIARDNHIEVETIIKDNSLNSDFLSVGQILKIRILDNAISEQYEECFGNDYTPVSNNPISYTVNKGDSLYSIAKKYNTTVSELMKINNLNSINLSIGQILKIPNGTTNNNTEIIYIVQKGDSLYQIAKKYNTTIDIIKRKNNLNNNNLAIGQQLII